MKPLNDTEKNIIIMTLGHLDKTQRPFEKSHDRYIKAYSYIGTLQLHLSSWTQKRLANQAVSEFEARYSDHFIDLQQTTDVMLAVTNRITGETQYYSLNNIIV